MQLTKRDIEFFKNISQVESGSFLLDYFKRLEEHAYNSKDWQEGDTKESAARAAKLIREHLIEKIRPAKSGGQVPSDFE